MIIKIVRNILGLIKDFKITYIKWRLRRNQNLFNDTNFLYGGGKIRHTKWGKHSGIGINPFIYDTIIGNFTNIASNCKIGLRDHIHKNFLISDFVYNGEQILPNGIEDLDGYWVKIGSDVWIGDSVIIMRGIKVGDGAIIGAGSVVTRSVPDFAIVGGNPAKFIKWRFPEQVRLKLKEIQWWELDDCEIIEKKGYLENLVAFDMKSYKFSYMRVKLDMKISNTNE